MMIGIAEMEIMDRLLDSKTNRIDILSNKLDRSERTLKYSLDKINEFFQEYYKYNVISIENQNIYLLKPYEEIQDILANINKKQYYLSIEERVELGVFQYLAGFNYTMEELSDFMDISLSTIKHIMPMIRAFLNNLDITLVNVSGVGLVAQGHERNIRKELSNYIYKNIQLSCNSKGKEIYINPKTNPYLKELLTIYLGDVPIGKLIEIVDEYGSSYTSFKNDELYKITLSNLIIIYKRNLDGYVIHEKRDLKLKNIETVDFLKNSFHKAFNISLPEEEFYYMAGSMRYSLKPNRITLDILLADMLNHLIDIFIKEKGLDLSYPRIRESIKIFNRHFHLSVDRMENGIYIENPLLNQILELHGELFNHIKLSLEPIEKCIGCNFSDNEIGYFTILIENILSTIVSENRKIKNIIIVCGLGYGTSILLKSRIEQYFKVNVIDVIPFNKLDLVSKENIDLIVSAIPMLKEASGIPVVEVSPLMTSSDMEVLGLAGLKYKKITNIDPLLDIIKRNCIIKDANRLEKELELFLKGESIGNEKQKYEKILNCIRTTNISFKEQATSWKEAVEVGGLLLVKSGLVDISYVEDMIENVEKYGPYMAVGNGLALPHGENNGNVMKTGISLITLENPVIFDNGEIVKTILCFCSRDGMEHIDVLVDFMSLVENHNLLEHIQRFSHLEELIDFIKKID